MDWSVLTSGKVGCVVISNQQRGAEMYCTRAAVSHDYTWSTVTTRSIGTAHASKEKPLQLMGLLA